MAASKKISVQISTSIGKVSARIDEAKKPKAVMVLAHGAGAGMDHAFMTSLAQGLADENITVIRYNFPFKENGKGRPDPPAVAEKTVEILLNKAHELFPKLPVFAAGKSFGGRMSSQRVSKDSPDFLKGIVFYGFPLHAPGAASVDRAEHLSGVKVPMLFLQGTRDALADLKLMEKVVKKLPLATMMTFEGADHSFKAGKKVFLEELVKATGSWIDAVLGK
ncbi:MAG TPA: alpha/beta family hydrolase [Cyclobacteriaceae bacterium]|nr:alpha/beta family hydrolase [Cyclobacteriaceae bacterium]